MRASHTIRENTAVTSTIRATLGRRATVLLAFAVAACDGGDESWQLAYRLPASQGRSYATTLTHEIDFDMGDHTSHAVREIRTGFTVRAGAGPATGTVQLDSVRASMLWGQARMGIDTRHLAGRGFGIAVTDTSPTFASDQVPIIDMGDKAGGPVRANLLVAYAYPRLPAEPVTAGSTWTERRTGPRLQGAVWVTEDVGTTHRVIGMETIDGTRCVRVESESTGTFSGGSMGELDLDFDGEIHGTASWCFDARSGALVELTGEETGRGSTPWPNRGTVRMDQTARVEVRTVMGEGR